MTTVVLADDHPVVRVGLRALIEDVQGLRVVGEAGDGLEAVEMVEELRPDVLVLDLMMPGLGGLEVIRRVRAISPGTRIVVLSLYSDEPYVVEALRSGACGYVVKEASASELVRAIQEVCDGRYYLSSQLAQRAIEVYLQTSAADAHDPYTALTPREREVLHMTAQGLSTAEIAARLYISRRTVENHRVNLMRKLGLKTRAQLIRFAALRGILLQGGGNVPL